MNPLRRFTGAYHKPCNVEYFILDEEKATFGNGWAKEFRKPSAEYIYRSATQLDGFPTLGQNGFYSGGGYVSVLKGKPEELNRKIDRLIADRWIDVRTRAVFIEFTIYNPGSNLFSVNTILAEFPSTTGIIPTFRFEPVDLIGNYHKQVGVYDLAIQIIFVIFLIYFAIREVRLIIRQHKEYFRHLWNLNELAIISLSITAIFIYFYRLRVTNSLLKQFETSKGLAYIKFQYAASWNELLSYVVGWLVFLTTLKFLRLLRFNRRMSLLGSTLRESRKDLGLFAIMFSIIFFAYIHLFYLLFSRYLLDYKSIISAAETNLNLLLGKFNFEAMVTAQPYLTPIFFVLFVITMVMITMNMFISILTETFSMVRRDTSKQSNDHEMVDFIIERFKIWSGIGMSKTTRDLNNKTPSSSMSSTSAKYQVRCLPVKVDQLLNSISRAYLQPNEIDSLFDPSPNAEMFKTMMDNFLSKDKSAASKNFPRLLDSEEKCNN